MMDSDDVVGSVVCLFGVLLLVLVCFGVVDSVWKATRPTSSAALVVCTLPGDTEPSYVHAKATRVNGAETDVWLEDGTYQELTSPCQVIFDTKR